MRGEGQEHAGQQLRMHKHSERPEHVDKLLQVLTRRHWPGNPHISKILESFIVSTPGHMGANPMQNTQDCHLIQRQTHT